jgi:hypothetical protein
MFKTIRHSLLVLIVSAGPALAQDELPHDAPTAGQGTEFTGTECAEFQKIYSASKERGNRTVQWVLRNLDTGRVIDQSSDPKQRLFGASTSKIFVAAALLDAQDGALNEEQTKLMDVMIMHSSNKAWRALQTQLGSIDPVKCGGLDPWACGQKRVLEFTQRMGYGSTRGFTGDVLRGNLGPLFRGLVGQDLIPNTDNVHGNELTAQETTQFLQDMYDRKFPGAEKLWEFMQRCRTGKKKGDKYMPSRILVGGKTGTYPGGTRLGQTYVEGKEVFVGMFNHAMFFKGEDGIQYGLTILANAKSPETVALLTGGLIRNYAGIKDGATCPIKLER